MAGAPAAEATPANEPSHYPSLDEFTARSLCCHFISPLEKDFL